MSQYHNLSDLKKVSRDLKKQAEAAEAARKKAALEARDRDAAGEAFRAAMKEMGVKPTDTTRGRVQKHPKKPEPVARQLEADRREVLEESLSDECDPVTFLESEDGLMFRRPDVSPEIPRKLYRGEWTVQAHIDLHGLFVEEARDAVAQFIRNAQIRGDRCLRIVHGKGYNSEGGVSVLKEMVRRWLKQKVEVMAFVQAPPHDGDAGAVIVLLDSKRRTHR
ncbi:Smr/MutS family protein [Sutterella sp.]|uniref:Smr/MutS family protein n=1 Tax=Sutterella sp. TaxID=1981025 RepID=UPI0026DFA746|nr:Smr/MutS family protein [Sutterella sp.]MDO5531514.1 Smr/MutS family protein [Sutterella sp.]